MVGPCSQVLTPLCRPTWFPSRLKTGSAPALLLVVRHAQASPSTVSPFFPFAPMTTLGFQATLPWPPLPPLPLPALDLVPVPLAW
jgi:hypothetical protein